MKPRTLVLLAAYNGEQWIEEQVASIFAQVDVNIQILCGVDPSTDRTISVVEKIQQNNPRIFSHLQYTAPSGSAAHNFRNLILNCPTDFEYYSLADQDDVWFPWKLKSAISILREASADGCSTNVLAFWPNWRILMIDKAQPQQQFDYVCEAAGPGCTYVITRALLLAIRQHYGKYDALHAIAPHDWQIYAIARDQAFKWVICKSPSMMYRQHNTNVVGANIGLIPLLSRMRQVLQGNGFSYIAQIASTSLSLPPYMKHRLTRQSVTDLFYIAMHAHKFRRRKRDALYLQISCLLRTAQIVLRSMRIIISGSNLFRK